MQPAGCMRPAGTFYLAHGSLLKKKHTNALNLKLQGPQQILSGLVKEISGFEAKPDLFITQLQQSNFTHFPQLSKVDKTNHETVESEQFHTALMHLKSDFCARFQDSSTDRSTTFC